MRNNKNNITLSLENIISFFRNITSHFTGKAKIITLVLIIIMLSFSNITLCSSNIFNSSNVSALSYQSNVELSFTFNPTLSVNISPSDLVISNLTPGTTSDSNAINVSVATNAAYGYTLSAIMNGDNSNLTHTNGANAFSSIATDASLSNLTTDNTWGYSYKNNLAPTPTWSSYSGLSNSADKVLFNTDGNSNGSIDFKIAAKASETQVSGAYTSTINFTATTKPMPKTIQDIAYMQTFAELDTTDLASVKNSMVKNTTYTLKDQRDEQEYTIAKLEDGKIWMTKDLNLAGETVLSSNDTDVDSSYIDSFSTSNNLTKTDNTIVLPVSSTSGFSVDNYSYIYNSGNITTSQSNCTDSQPCNSYYSYDAATLGSNRNIGTDNQNAPYSICPKGWRLPSTYNGSGTEAENADFRALIIAFGGSNSVQTYNNNTSPTGSELYALLGPNTIPNFLLTGNYNKGSFGNPGGNAGSYWSSTSGIHRNYARYFNFSTSIIHSVSDNRDRRNGYAVRCLAR